MGIEWQYMIDIRPEWVNREQSANWESAVRQLIVSIASVQTGQVLLNGIRFWNKWVPISPYDFSQGPCNAFAGERLGTARDGRSYGAIVRYSPHLFYHGGACFFSSPNDAGAAPNEILFHELVHAFRRVSGKRQRANATGGLINYDSNEEFNAILVTNIFVTDPTNKKKSGLRRDHHGLAPLEASLATSFSFFESSRNAFDLVQQFCTDHKGLSGALAKVPATFNPIATFIQDPAEAQKRSRSAQAFVRDAAGWALAMKRAMFS
jgi:hypothetical protein